MGKPHLFSRYRCTEYIGVTRRTGRTETSKYPEEKKSTEIPKVAASEIGAALKLQFCVVEQSGKSGRYRVIVPYTTRIYLK